MIVTMKSWDGKKTAFDSDNIVRVDEGPHKVPVGWGDGEGRVTVLLGAPVHEHLYLDEDFDDVIELLKPYQPLSLVCKRLGEKVQELGEMAVLPMHLERCPGDANCDCGVASHNAKVREVLNR